MTRSVPKSMSSQPFFRSTLLVTTVAVLLWAVPGMAQSARQDGEQGERSSIAKRYKATRALMVDQTSGEMRMPTQSEVDATVATLARLTSRASEGLRQTTSDSGTVAVDLEEGFAGVMLSRPNEDRTWETLCVFTFEEAIAFLGLETE